LFQQPAHSRRNHVGANTVGFDRTTQRFQQSDQLFAEFRWPALPPPVTWGAGRQQIGIVAKMIGPRVDAIRFYERNGLLPRRPGTEDGFRRYGENDMETLPFCPARAGPGIQTERGSNQVGLLSPEVTAQTQ
jgi:hypothetical protein